MVQILFVRVAAPGTHDSHVTDVRWYNPQTGAMGTTNIASMVDFLKEAKGKAYVCNGSAVADIGWVDGDRPYIQVRSNDPSLALHALPKME